MSDGGADKGHRPHLVSAKALLLLGLVAVIVLYLLFPREMRFALNSNNYKVDSVSIAYLHAMLRSTPADSALRLELVRDLLNTGRWHEAQSVLAKFSSNNKAQKLEADLLRLRIHAAHVASLPVHDKERDALMSRLAGQVQGIIERMDRASIIEWEWLYKLALFVNRPDLASQVAKKLAALQPKLASIWWLRAGRWDLAAGKQLAAAEDYMHARPKNGGAHAVLLALSAAKQAGIAEREQAIAIAQEAIHRYPNNAAIYDSAIKLALKFGQVHLALRWNSQLLIHYPNNPGALRRQRDMALAANDLKSALIAGRHLLNTGVATLNDHVVQAHVEEWLGHNSAAEKQWHWLTLHRNKKKDYMELARLARENYDYPMLADVLERMHKRFGLNDSQRDELVNTYIVLGDPNRAQNVLSRDIHHHSHDRAMRVRLAKLQAFDDQLESAIKTWQKIGERFGMDAQVRLALMRLYWKRFELKAALNNARAAKPGFASASDYELSIAGELGWRSGDDDLMNAAYKRLWTRPAKIPLVPERLALAALQRGNIESAVHWAERGWSRYQDKSIMLRILPATVDANRWDLAREILAEVGNSLDGHAGYWLVRGDVDSHDGNFKLSVTDYKQALKIDPGSSGAKAGLLWSLIALNNVDELRMYLHKWAAGAREETGLWSAFAAGYMQIGEYSKALAFYERKMRFKSNDYLWAMDYAQALDKAGYSTAAWRMRNYALKELRLQALGELKRGRPGDATIAVIDLSRQQEGSPIAKGWLMHSLNGLSPRALAKVLVSWYLAENRPDIARRWMLSQALGEQALPAWQQLDIAIAHEDLPVVERLLQENELGTSDRVLAERTIGRRSIALSEALEGIGQGGGIDNSSLREAAASLSAEVPNFTDLGVDARRIGELGISSMFVDGVLSRSAWTLKTQISTSHLYADPTILNLGGTGVERNGLLGLTVHRLRDRWHASAGEDLLGAHDLVQWGLGYDYTWSPHLAFSIDYARNALSYASAQLRAGGARDSLTLSLDASYGARLFANMSIARNRYHSRSGDPLGQGYSAEWQFGQRIWVGTNHLNVSFSGNMMNDKLVNVLPVDFRAILPSGSQVGDVLPAQYNSAGLGFDLGRGDPLGIYPDVASPRYNLSAWAGWSWPENRVTWNAQASVGSRVLGSDDLRLSASYGAGSVFGQVRARLMLIYRWFFGR